jgi:Fic-DOC domain mobile mystery protein B
MFHQVWAWAGTYRTTERNLGVPAWRIATDVATLLDDAHFWISAEDDAAMPTDEICLRLSHRAAAIHPFPNGNGRWSRLLADTAAVSLGRLPFSWGRSPLRSHNEIRGAYLAALRAADRTLDYGPLISFARESSGR